MLEIPPDELVLPLDDPPPNPPSILESPPSDPKGLLLPELELPPMSPDKTLENPLPALCPPIKLSRGEAFYPPPRSPFAVSKNPATPVFFSFPNNFLT